MGKIVCIGGGRYDDGEVYPIAEKIVSLCGKKNPKVVFLPTAGFDDINGDEPIEAMFRRLGCEYSILLLTDEALGEEKIKAEILGADIIYAGGGNLKFLMDTWKKTKADVFLKEAFGNGTVLSGYSSGSMCWFGRGYDDCGENGAFMFVDCIGLLPFCNCPHYEGGNWPSFTEAVKEQSLSGVACENGAALIYDDGEFYTMHGNDGGDTYYLNAAQGYRKIKLGEDAGLLKKDAAYSACEKSGMGD